MSDGTGVIEEISRRGTEEVSVDWKIPNFPSLLDGKGKWWYLSSIFGYGYASPAFRFCDQVWRLIMWSNLQSEKRNPAKGWVRLDIRRCDGGPPATVRCSVGIRGSGGVEKSREKEKKFEGYGHYPWNNFCSRSYLLEHRTRLMPDDTITIRCVLKRTGAATAGVLSHPHSSNQVAPTNESQSSDKQDACTQTDCNLEAEVLTGLEHSSVKRGCEKLSEDISKLLASGEDSDVTVQVGDVEFKVHRNILSARSPVLAAMFRHETEERASNSVKIDDCDPDVFREYLHYLYTGSVHSLTKQTVFDLYSIADKYLAEELKQLCLEHIKVTLCVKTFCDTVKLALMHGENDLLQLAIDFATKNIPSIIRSVEWQHFNQEFPTEANEILIKCIKL